ncbi:hypothetical protein GIB67_024401 [Kingdonia uniflora]|uniref:DDE Tnp4 domain-containing protein n=1 Tax=Kingdonia uniflora TaxID=39325 RepID=A0A7J7LFB2_9MAGN|nr:hypothetical protein GIB67_024401 [Kingdonia uniflora]
MEKGLLSDTRNYSVEEEMMHFLHIIGHNVRFRVAEARYFRSLETVSRQFNETLTVVAKLYKYLVENHKDFIQNGGNQPQVTVDSRFTPYFKDCLGALDETHIAVNVPKEEQIKFKSGIKGRTTQNVLVACSFDLKFTYVLAGWKRIAHDQRVLDDAHSRMNPFIIPNGKYYLSDEEYTNEPGILAPYRNTRYHLNEHIGRRPQMHKKLFNKRHASLRNTIDREFGILKKCFPLLSTDSWFPYKIQVRITLVCFVLHNFIMGVDPNNPITVEASNDDQAPTQDAIRITTASSSQSTTYRGDQNRWANFKDNFVTQRFNVYTNWRNNQSNVA